ncbi:regulatory-associated protein of mTOR-like isoform X2 [Macrosteles quadrilineatus]|uniref:regulatory-associated protein of mTOR-like isoform X2 n=1 Tax=Macrosteles quadrilineatus TaxID=74068 RepID=UPI0023E302E7|nr:regulatory-associated protein of mTOR-like isoform X2 [Macrosteles quadrilineatus]
MAANYFCSKASDAANEDWQLPLSFLKKHHVETIEGAATEFHSWRMKERMKTVSVALVICLNVGVDPPDIVKTQPCARLECWIDPLSMSPQKALESVGASLQKQYERWQPKARYKLSLDPTVDEVKKLCTSLRRNAKEERVLFHYNGHGVPKPTSNGEIWVFNRMYTQYIPLSVYDLQTWMGAPSIYVYDCSNAGVIVDLFRQLADQHEKEYEQANPGAGNRGAVSFKNCIQLAACGADQILPMNPDLPADLFTSCLTTPIKIALRWFVMQNQNRLEPRITLDLIDKIPGQLSDRRTMLGELNWIFTAITDTIAWNTLPRDQFQKLFRQDLLVASLFRNLLLAERIMRSYDCTPVSWPVLPPTYQHPMWQAWDLALDLSLAQLPAVLANEESFTHSPFFEEQLTAFQVWLQHGSEHRSPPEQLPIVLQVLLSQVHRLRALELLGKFLDLGPWAVNLALSVGIFPYVLKLLQGAKELRPLLVFIWAKILAVDITCQVDLVRDNGHKYFLSILQDTSVRSDDRVMSVLVLASIVHKHPAGQDVARANNLVSICLEHLQDSDARMRQWLALCLARLWDNYDQARWCGVRDVAHEKLYVLLNDPVPEVRAAAVYALGTFISSVTERSEHANNIDQSVAMMLINTVSHDMCPLVRKELVVALQWMVLVFENSFLSVALHELRRDSSQVDKATDVLSDAMLSPTSSLKRNVSRERIRTISNSLYASDHSDSSGHGYSAQERLKRVSSSSSISSLSGCSLMNNLPQLSFGSVYMKMWQALTALDSDPFPGVSQLSRTITDYIRDQVCAWPPHGLHHKEEAWAGSTGHLLSVKDLTKELTETRLNTSMSLPPSPSNRSYLGESPPPNQLGSANDLNRLTGGHRHLPRARKNMPNTITEDCSEENTGSLRPLVTTQFTEWCCKYFAQPTMANGIDQEDFESPRFYQREYRYLENTKLRNTARVECIRLNRGRIDHQVFSVRTQHAATVLHFHPYLTHVAAAGKDTISVWDYQANTKLCYWKIGSANVKITSVNFVNAHDTCCLLVTGSEDGTVRVWNNYNGTAAGTREPQLVTAWQALPESQSPSRSTHSSGSGGSGMVMTWDQALQQLIVADWRVIRVWDADKELKVCDLASGSDSPITCLDYDHSGGSLLAAGYSDGAVRLFDRRLSANEAKVMTYREHTQNITCVNLRGDGGCTLLTGSGGGDFRVIDTRKHSTVVTNQLVQGMTAMAPHRMADIFACSGAVHQYIGVYSMSGVALNTIKYHEWFMASHFVPVTSLAFHPLRSHMAAGSLDTSITVYSVEPKR